MFQGGMDSQTLLLVASVFGLVAGLWFCGLLIWTMRSGARFQRIQARLGLVANPEASAKTLRLWHEGQEVTALVPSMAHRFEFFRRLMRLPQDAGWNVSGPALYSSVLGIAACVALMIFGLTGNGLATLGGAVVVLVVFWIYLKQRVATRIALFERQFIDALQLISRSLRAGHPLLVAFRLVAEEMTDPVAGIFREICQQQALGVELGQATRNVAGDSTSPDFQLFAASISIQLRTGGNLAEMMDRLAAVIRERVRLSRRVRVLTAQTQFSKRVLLALPIFVFFLLQALNSEYMAPLYSTHVGRWLLVVAGGAMLVGAWVMDRMARLD